MRPKWLATASVATMLFSGNAMAHDRIRITAAGISVMADLEDNAASHSLLAMLPLTIEMRDHLRQEKTGSLPSALPEVHRQREFQAGTLGLWGANDFVVYYSAGRVPEPGIVILGRVVGDVSAFDRPGPVTMQVENVQQ